MMKISNVKADQTDDSAKKEALIRSSASFLAEISVRSPRKSFIFITYKKILLDQSIQKILYFILKKEALIKSLWKLMV